MQSIVPTIIIPFITSFRFDFFSAGESLTLSLFFMLLKMMIGRSTIPPKRLLIPLNVKPSTYSMPCFCATNERPHIIAALISRIGPIILFLFAIG